MTGARILLVEDSPTQAHAMRSLLEKHGHDVAVAVDGEEGLKLCQASQPDVVILDILLPKKDGFEVCRQMKSDPTRRLTPVLMLTVQEDLESKLRGFEAGANDYLTKPFVEAELLARVGAMLRMKTAQERAYLLSTTDDLTGLFNYRFLMDRLREELSFAKRHETPLACAMVDVDGFKRLNDLRGHRFGDSVLGRIAELLRASARTEDIVARYGGDEFVLVLRGASVAGALIAVERLRQSVAETPFSSRGKVAEVTVSSGVAAYPESVPEALVDQLLRAADMALYAAKKKGQNRTEVYVPAPMDRT
ncbi:MAG: diguanylate cyclase [Planctomycetota bacterium]